MSLSNGPHISPHEKADIEQGIGWFKKNFGAEINQAIQGTPYTLDILTAIAVQETFVVWGKAYKIPHLSIDDVLTLCVGDPLDKEDGRDDSFPQNRAVLESKVNGPQMFQIARRALEGLVRFAPYEQRFVDNPNKFCHAFGIFQYDIQAFLHDADYFLNKRWGDFSLCLCKCLNELNEKSAIYYPNAVTMSDAELIYLSIAYNHGSVDLHRDFNQGYLQDGFRYGSWIELYLGFAKETPAAA
jgi:hypothetical protein